MCLSVIVSTEHRNMLLEDAVAMIVKNFDNYCHRLTKRLPNSIFAESRSPSLPVSTTVTMPSLRTVPEHLQPDTVTRRLIGLLSADCELTYSELEHIISYLKSRQKALVSTAALSSDSGFDSGRATISSHRIVS